MPSRTVYFVANEYYHIYNRGSEKRTIFQSPRDYNNFLTRTKEKAEKYSIDILAYCLMPNHFHFLLKQVSDIPLTRFMNAIQLGHAKYFNTKYERIGPLFQGRFKAKLIDNKEYLLHLSAYIHRNPVNFLREYPYSSYREYINPEKRNVSKTDVILSYFSKTNSKLSYEDFVENFKPNIEALYPLMAAVD